MHYLHHSATVFAAIVVGTIASTHAQAGSRVGGDDVSEDEFIRTEIESSARISFIDETDIRMGPAAKMKIDRVVFKSGRAVSELVVTAEAGALRWNSGVSQSEAYLIKTQTVIIKIRGTILKRSRDDSLRYPCQRPTDEGRQRGTDKAR